MPSVQERAHMPAKEADLIRRVIGTMLRPRASLSDLAIQHGLNYDVFREFIRGRASSLPCDADRNNIRAAAAACLPALGLTTLNEAARLPPYSPRRGVRTPGRFETMTRRFHHKVVALLRNVQPSPLKEAAGKIGGLFDCYRLLPDRVVKSQMVISYKEGLSWLDFVEQWERDGETLEYWGYIFPTRDFLYFCGFNRKHGVPKMMFGRLLSSRNGAVHIRGISAAHAPGMNGIMGGNIYLEKSGPINEESGNPRRLILLEKTGDMALSDVDERIRSSLTGNDPAPSFVKISRPDG